MTTKSPTADDNPFSPEAVADFREWLRSQTPERLAERMTTYKPGVPHYWHGQPVKAITKDQLLGAEENAEEITRWIPDSVTGRS